MHDSSGMPSARVSYQQTYPGNVPKIVFETVLHMQRPDTSRILLSGTDSVRYLIFSGSKQQSAGHIKLIYEDNFQLSLMSETT
jgi:hypothetical protein